MLQPRGRPGSSRRRGGGDSRSYVLGRCTSDDSIHGVGRFCVFDGFGWRVGRGVGFCVFGDFGWRVSRDVRSCTADDFGCRVGRDIGSCTDGDFG